MATAQQTLDATNAALNSFQSLVNLVSAQLQEVMTVISDFSDQLKNGGSGDPATLDTVVAQLGNLKTSADAESAQVQISLDNLKASDPGPVVPPPTPEPPPEPPPVV